MGIGEVGVRVPTAKILQGYAMAHRAGWSAESLFK